MTDVVIVVVVVVVVVFVVLVVVLVVVVMKIVGESISNHFRSCDATAIKGYVYLSVIPSVRPSVCPSVCLTVRASVCNSSYCLAERKTANDLWHC